MFEAVSSWELQQYSQNDPELHQQSDASGIHHSGVHSHNLHHTARHSGHESSEQKGVHEDYRRNAPNSGEHGQRDV